MDIGHTISFKNTCQITSFQIYHSFVVLSDLWILSYVECVGRRLETEAHYGSTSYVTPNRVCTRAATKPFFSKGTLKRHKCHQHAETCPYVCDVCGKSFALQTDLRRHKARESGKLNANVTFVGLRRRVRGHWWIT